MGISLPLQPYEAECPSNLLQVSATLTFITLAGVHLVLGKHIFTLESGVGWLSDNAKETIGPQNLKLVLLIAH